MMILISKSACIPNVHFTFIMFAFSFLFLDAIQVELFDMVKIEIGGHQIIVSLGKVIISIIISMNYYYPILLSAC